MVPIVCQCPTRARQMKWDPEQQLHYWVQLAGPYFADRDHSLPAC